jgi:hypothetical protein
VSNLKSHGLQATSYWILLSTQTVCLPKFTTVTSLAEELSNFLQRITNNHARRSSMLKLKLLDTVDRPNKESYCSFF